MCDDRINVIYTKFRHGNDHTAKQNMAFVGMCACNHTPLMARSVLYEMLHTLTQSGCVCVCVGGGGG